MHLVLTGLRVIAEVFSDEEKVVGKNRQTDRQTAEPSQCIACTAHTHSMQAVAGFNSKSALARCDGARLASLVDHARNVPTTLN